MLPLSVTRNISLLDSKIGTIDQTLSAINAGAVVSTADAIIMQNISSNYIVVSTAGLIETAVQDILKEFCGEKCSPQLMKYLEKNLERNTTMNCEKIIKLLKRFDDVWADQFADQIDDAQKNAIDSIKKLRDELAHGKNDGTGIVTVKTYYAHSKNVLQLLSRIVR